MKGAVYLDGSFSKKLSNRLEVLTMWFKKKKIKITDRNITKTELKTIYADFEKIERLNGIKDRNEKRYEYVAEEKGRVIGLASGLTDHKWFYLSDLWVHEDFRRTGLGTKLLSMLEDKVKDIGIEHIYTWTAGPNNADFYQKLGYQVFTVFEDFYEVDGYDQIGYRKDF